MCDVGLVEGGDVTGGDVGLVEGGDVTGGDVGLFELDSKHIPFWQTPHGILLQGVPSGSLVG